MTTATVVPQRPVKDVINGWAYEGERVLHGNPSGVDNTVIVNGELPLLAYA